MGMGRGRKRERRAEAEATGRCRCLGQALPLDGHVRTEKNRTPETLAGTGDKEGQGEGKGRYVINTVWYLQPARGEGV